MLSRIWNFLRGLFGFEDRDPAEDTRQIEQRRDNLPLAPVQPLPDELSTEEKEEPALWYPKRYKGPEVENLTMSTRGYYLDKFPRGAVVHTTSGRSRKRALGGNRNALTNFLQAMRFLKYACNETPYCFFVIDRDGNVFQQFPLDRWGYHAGDSNYPGLPGDVSNELVGIEVMCAGKLERYVEKTYKAWFTRVDKGDKLFKGEEVKFWPSTENIQAGPYHQMNGKQKKAIADLVLWMDQQSERFSLEYVVGHDEVAPNRKSDPGGSIGMPMSDFREMLKDIKKEEESR